MAHGSQAGRVTIQSHDSKAMELIHNLLVALTVSFIAMSLGAAFGVLSGRGAFVGMFSAGIIAMITGALGGTRVQCSGPVAPMAAIMAVIFAAVNSEYAADVNALGGMTPDHFLNLICFLCGGVMLLMAALRLGFLISYVPDAVISGFMTGIALIIWIGQTKILFGYGGKDAIHGHTGLNMLIVAGTIALIFLSFPLLAKISRHVAKLMPGTLVALLVVTAVATLLKLDVQHVDVAAKLPDFHGLIELVKSQLPQNVSWAAVKKALPSGIEFALISYLDTLMVALIIDRMRGEKTRKNKELMAQGIANATVGLIGGIPGTQASIRSVLMTKEGATMRLAGFMVGVFVILEMLLLQDWLGLIPQAVFIGILLKVGWDVCDRKPIWAFVSRNINRPNALDFFTIIGTAVVTVYNLTLAVLLFTVIYYAVTKWKTGRFPLPQEPTDQIEEEVQHALHEKV